MARESRKGRWISTHDRSSRSREILSPLQDLRVLLPSLLRNLLLRGQHVMDQAHVPALVELQHRLIGQPQQHFLINRVKADASADAPVDELHFDIDGLY